MIFNKLKFFIYVADVKNSFCHLFMKEKFKIGT